MLKVSYPCLYFVTPEIGSDSSAWVHLIKEAVFGGVKMVQVRDKRSSSKKLIEVVGLLQPFLKRHSVPLIINDRVDIALILKADGVHIGQNDFSVNDARALIGPKGIVGLSVETLDQAAQAAGADYLAASPIFATPTKRDTEKPWGLAGLKLLRALSGLPIIAIGGIKHHNVREVLQAGANGIAVVSAIAAATCPRMAAARLCHELGFRS